MLDLEAGFHPELGTFLDGEGLLVQVLQGAGCAEVDDDVAAAGDFEAQGEDDDFAWVAGVGDAFAGTQA